MQEKVLTEDRGAGRAKVGGMLCLAEMCGDREVASDRFPPSPCPAPTLSTSPPLQPPNQPQEVLMPNNGNSIRLLVHKERVPCL